eukprot:4503672-Amphidinium_carterae.1
MRAFATHAGTAAVMKSKAIEAELFNVFGSDPKAYKRRARAIIFNISAQDGALRTRILDDSLQPKDL